ncbi:hypothetical protein [Rhizobium sp. K102]|jgi:hypothetical protein|uniref:hypothetical protein n=1 Tax=Rhizobium sp. K102 TaxID=2918527 RepID=UPI001EFBC653|nr:hypothetical protein [Rhizobium sp. K102]ULR45592.1 hypothetical protein MHI61_10505 [Rhizobium sp. K102]
MQTADRRRLPATPGITDPITAIGEDDAMTASFPYISFVTRCTPSAFLRGGDAGHKTNGSIFLTFSRASLNFMPDSLAHCSGVSSGFLTPLSTIATVLSCLSKRRNEVARTQLGG